MDETAFNPEQALAYARDLRNRAKRLQEETDGTEIDVTSPDHLVTVTVTIPGKITDIKISRPLIEAGDPEKLSKLVLKTIRTAQEGAAETEQDLIKCYLPNLPSFGKIFEEAEKDGPLR